MGNGTGEASRGPLATVTSLIKRRIERQSAVSQVVKLPGGQLRDELAPNRHGGGTDMQGPCNTGLVAEMSDGGFFAHDAKLSMPSSETQPCLVTSSLSLLYMSSQAWKKCLTLTDRLRWSVEYANRSPADLARHLDISTAAMSEWFTGKTKNPKLRNIFKAAQFCKVYGWWLAIGEGTPYDGISSEFEGIAGQDLLIAKELSKLDDRALRETVGEIIAARRASSNEAAHKKRKA